MRHEQVGCTGQRRQLRGRRGMHTHTCGAQAIRALDIQTQRVASLSTDFSRAMGEVSDLRLRYEEAHSGGAAAAQAAQQLAQQLVGVSADVRAQEGRLAATSSQLSEALRANAELRGHVAVLSDEVARGAQVCAHSTGAWIATSEAGQAERRSPACVAVALCGGVAGAGGGACGVGAAGPAVHRGRRAHGRGGAAAGRGAGRGGPGGRAPEAGQALLPSSPLPSHKHACAAHLTRHAVPAWRRNSRWSAGHPPRRAGGAAARG